MALFPASQDDEVTLLRKIVENTAANAAVLGGNGLHPWPGIGEIDALRLWTNNSAEIAAN